MLKDQIASVDSMTQASAYAKYAETVPCHVCNGAKLGKKLWNIPLVALIIMK